MRLADILTEAKTGTFYYKPGEKLPPDMVQKFSQLGNLQRGEPEQVMRAIQHKYTYMTWINTLLEHIGDLIHRFAETVEFNGKIVSDIERKLSSGIQAINNSTGNMKELTQSLARGVETGEIPDKAQYVKDYVNACEQYTVAHSQLPCYNDIHLLCKKACVALGAMEFEECNQHLKTIQSYFKDNTINKRYLEITRGKDGQLKVIG